ncbi:MAG: ABC transporter permease subunit [Oligoflexales bacterium]
MIYYQQFLAIFLNSIQTLKRDRIFIPALFSAIGIICIAIIASDWGFENIQQILFDIGNFGFHLTGSFVAIFWGTQLISKATQDGSSQMQLIAPIPRGLWIIGTYCGLICILFLFAILLISFWQTTIWVYAGWFLSFKQILALSLHLISWCVLGALAVCLASITSHSTALFSTICLWLIGLISPILASSIPPNTPAVSRATLQILSHAWNFQIFQLDPLTDQINLQHTFWKIIYAATLITGLISLSICCFQRRDLGRNTHL